MKTIEEKRKDIIQLIIQDAKKKLQNKMKNEGHNIVVDDIQEYLEINRVKLKELNNENFDVLIYAIENHVSLELVEFIIRNANYPTLNYTFSATECFENYFSEELDLYVNDNTIRVPLFSAICEHQFKIANLLIEKGASITYKNLDNQNVLDYLYYNDYISNKTLKYILRKDFPTSMINKDSLSKIIENELDPYLFNSIFKNCIYDNHSILYFLSLYTFKTSLSQKQLIQIISNEKNKITIDNSMYELAIVNLNFPIITTLLKYDGRSQGQILKTIKKYSLLSSEYNDLNFLETIITIEISNSYYYDIVSIFNQIDNSSIFHKALKLSIEKLLNIYTLHNIKNRNFENVLSLASHFTSKDILIFVLEKVLKYLPKGNENINWEEQDLTIIENWNIHHIALFLNLAFALQDFNLINYLLNNTEIKSNHFIDVRHKNTKNIDVTSLDEEPLSFNNIFTYVLRPNMNVEIKKRLGTPLFLLSLLEKKYRYLNFLLKQNVFVQIDLKKNYSPLIKAIYKNDITTVKSIVIEDSKEDIMKSKTYQEINKGYLDFYFTPLVASYLLNRKEIFEFMIYYYDIDELDLYGYSLIHYAILKEDQETVDYLLSNYKANINYKENCYGRGHLALEMAILIENMELCSLLLCTRNILINDRNEEENIPIMTLLRTSSDSFKKAQFKMKCLKRLIKEGAQTNFIDRLAKSSLIYALHEPSDYQSIAQLLMKNGATNVECIESIDNMNYTPLLLAIQKNCLPIVKLLIENGATIQYLEEQRIPSPIEYAIELRRKDILQYFLNENKISISKRQRQNIIFIVNNKK